MKTRRMAYAIEYTINGETTTEAGPFTSKAEARRVAASFARTQRGAGEFTIADGPPNRADVYVFSNRRDKRVEVVTIGEAQDWR